MSSSAVRGAVLVAFAALLGFLVLRGAADNAQFPVSTGAAAEVTAEPEVEVTPDNGVAVVTPTTVIVTDPPRLNSEVSVLVANGTSVSGLARRLTSQLLNLGFLTREPKNADDPQVASKIYYRPGYAAEATVVRDSLGGVTPIEPMPEPDPFVGVGVDLGPVNVLVLVGDDELAAS